MTTYIVRRNTPRPIDQQGIVWHTINLTMKTEEKTADCAWANVILWVSSNDPRAALQVGQNVDVSATPQATK